MKQIKLGLFIVLFLAAQQVAGQYNLPLYTPGNSGGLSTDNINFAFSVTGQNVIGIAENSGNKVFFGVLAPLTLTTDITQSEKFKKCHAWAELSQSVQAKNYNPV